MKHHHHHHHQQVSSSYGDAAVPSSSSSSSSNCEQSSQSLIGSGSVSSAHSLPSASSSSSPAAVTATQSTVYESNNNNKPSTMMAAEDPATSSFSRDATSSTAAETVVVERRGEYAAVCKWAIASFPKVKARALWSKYFEVGGYDCRLLIYPKGDSQALPGYVSIYLQIMDPRNTTSSKWDCFASYRLSIQHPTDPSKSIHRDSWHRFSSKKKSHGWCDFTPSNSILEPKLGFLFFNTTNHSNHTRDTDTCFLLVTADIMILNESVSFSRELNGNTYYNSNELGSTSSPAGGGGGNSANVAGDASLTGKFTWKVHNFSLFKEMIKTQKIMSPVFPAGECNLRISVYQSSVNGNDYLSMCLESKDTEKTLPGVSDRSCWCLFRMSVLNQKPGGLNHVHRDSYGRFAGDNKSGDNTSLGWNDYMKMADFVGSDSGYLVDDVAVFSTSFHVIREQNIVLPPKQNAAFGKNSGNLVSKKFDGHFGRFSWKIENFTRLKDLLKKRKITGLCIKSRRFQIGNRDCRLIVYPRGQSQPPCHLSVFLEVTDSRNTHNDWSCFVSHRLSVINQKEEKSVTKESQNRYSKAAKDWGWREFVTLTSLFDQDSGFLDKDVVHFYAEVLILKETSIYQDCTDEEYEPNALLSSERLGKKSSFTWKVENFMSFKEIMETRKIFSKFFQAGGCELRIGVYESFDTICIYLESDQSAGSDPDKNFWVRYRMAIVNQKNPSKTVWKESSICTKTWNNSVLQFMKVSDMVEPDAGFLLRDTVVFVCEILDCCPWFEFSDLEVLASEDDQDALTTDPDELIDSEDSEGISGDEEDIFRNLLSRAGFHLTYGDNPSQPQVTLREKLLMDAGAIAGFLTGLRVYLDDPAKVKRLLLPTKISGCRDGKKSNKNDESSSPSLMNMLMGVKVLQQAIIDLLLDIMVECCQPSEGSTGDDSSEISSKPSLDDSGSTTLLESDRGIGVEESAQLPLHERLDLGIGESTTASAVQSSDVEGNATAELPVAEQPICPPETSALGFSDNPPIRSKTKWPEQSEELLGLIVNSLRALDGAVPQGCPEPRRRPQSAQKIALVLDKAPKHLQPDLVSLVPKLVEHSEHPLVACALLDRLQKPDAEPSLRLPVFGALSQLECNSEVWERVLFQSFALLADSNDEPLEATIDFILKAAIHCQHLPQAVRAVRSRLKVLGIEVSPCVLDYLCLTVNSCADIAEAFMRDIDSNDLGDHSSAVPCGTLLLGESGNTERMHAVNQQNARANHYFSDIYILIEMLSIPCLAVEAAQIFERGVARGVVVAQSMAMVLERRLSRPLNSASQYVTENFHQTDVTVEGDRIEHLRAHQQDDFSTVISLAETMALSKDPCVRGFVKMIYTIMFKWYADEPHRLRMLKRLVDRATSTTESNREIDLDLEILVILACEEQEIVRPVLSMMREVAELANVDRAALWHQLCAIEDEILRLREESKSELGIMAKEKALLSQKLSETEAANSRLKSEMKNEADRFARERKELTEQIQEVESQLEWLRSEKDDEISKLSGEKKVLQERLHDAETQLSQLRSRKRDELKRVVKEKNALAERLKNAEAARKRYDDELKRFASENITREEVRQSLEEEVRRLTRTVAQTEGEKREKEEQVARFEAYIDASGSKLQAFEQCIHNLKASLQEEMSRHAPLYGVGLEALSMKELETLSRIHEDGLRQIHLIQQRKGSSPAGGSPLVNPHTIARNHQGLYSPGGAAVAPPPPMAVGLAPSVIQQNGVHSNGHKILVLFYACLIKLEDIKVLEEKLQNAYNENSKLKVKHQEDENLWKGLESKFSSTKTLCDQLTDTLQHLASLVQAAEKHNLAFEERLSASSASIDDLHEQMNSVSLRLKASDETVKTREKELRELQAEKLNIEKSLDTELKGSLALIEEKACSQGFASQRLVLNPFISQSTSKDAVIKTFEATVASNGLAMESLNSKLERLDINLKQKEEDIKSLRSSKEGLEKEKDYFLGVNKELFLRLDTALQRIKNLEEFVDLLTAKLVDLNSQSLTFSEKVSQMISLFESCFKLLDDEKRIASLRTQKKFDNLQDHLTLVASEKDGLQMFNQELKNKVIELQNGQEFTTVQHAEKCRLAEEKIRRLEYEVETLQSQKSEMDVLITQLQENVQTLTENLSISESKMKDIQLKLSELEIETKDSIERLQEVVTEKEGGIDALKKEIENRDEQIDSLQKQVCQINVTLEEKDRLVEELKIREKQLEDHKTKIEVSLGETETKISEAKKQYDQMLERRLLLLLGEQCLAVQAKFSAAGLHKEVMKRFDELHNANENATEAMENMASKMAVVKKRLEESQNSVAELLKSKKE
ncbi:OLC1v1027990C1 [Oldenlandia corymbosa var. corymbosa]|uniref:OLC1v1027990C1 n=1 Tax=Oldenlandia corymbosa var. corymbosa TaxID=529605 RepID=A0AAV1CCH4_OLDCO|nr:OLC1v1027990C1 [Oldenlandia corymbosa var. corymbosa]